MTSTWHHNTSPWKLITEAKDPFKALLHDFMYHGTPPRKEGKVPFISVWRQRKLALLIFLSFVPFYFCANAPTPN